ncbi:enoyl-CoA hydratase [compost metagenome]
MTLDVARRIAQMPRLGLQLTKQAVNNAEDLMGKRATMDMVFGLHHFAHAHNELISGDKLGGYDARAMAQSQRNSMEA